MSVASINDLDVSKLRLQLPSWGVWWCDVDVVGEQSLAVGDSVTIAIGDAAYVGTIVMGGTSNGRSAYRVAGGAASWNAIATPVAYTNDLGVRLATLATDAANDVGETVDTSGLSGTIGPSFVRASDSASRVLDAIAPRAWYVDVDGVTKFGARMTAALTTEAPRTLVRPGAGMLTLAPSPGDIASYIPGVSVDGVVAVDVQIDVGEGLRVTLYSSPWGLSRRARALRALVRAFAPETRWNGVYEYRVGLVESGDQRLALQPVRSVLGLPDLRFVRVRPGLFGLRAKPQLGSLCLVAFVDADATRPVVVAGDDADAPGFLPDEASIDGTDDVRVGESSAITRFGPSSRSPVARVGDSVLAGPFAGTVTSGSTYVESG